MTGERGGWGLDELRCLTKTVEVEGCRSLVHQGRVGAAKSKLRGLCKCVQVSCSTAWEEEQGVVCGGSSLWLGGGLLKLQSIFRVHREVVSSFLEMSLADNLSSLPLPKISKPSWWLKTICQDGAFWVNVVRGARMFVNLDKSISSHLFQYLFV